MSYSAIITNINNGQASTTEFPFSVSFIDKSQNPNVINQYDDIIVLGTDVSNYTTNHLNDFVLTKAQSYATLNDWTVDEYLFIGPNVQPNWNQSDTGQPDFIQNKPAILSGNPTIDNTVSRTIQTVAGAGNGWQISASRNSWVTYACNIQTTSTIGSPADGNIVLEVAATNSSTAGDWMTIGKLRNAESVSLGLALQSVQNIGGCLSGFVPDGWYVRLRSTVTTGTASFSMDSGQEVIL